MGHNLLPEGEHEQNDEIAVEQFDANVPLPLPPRCLSHPSSADSRRPGKDGKVGSQRCMKDIFNKAFLEFTGRDPSERGPLTGALVRSAFSLIRQHFYGILKLPRGQLLYTSLQYSHTNDLIKIKKQLEKRIPELLAAKAQWAAEGLVKDVLRRDRITTNDTEAPFNSYQVGAPSGAENTNSLSIDPEEIQAYPERPCAQARMLPTPLQRQPSRIQPRVAVSRLKN